MTDKQQPPAAPERIWIQPVESSLIGVGPIWFTRRTGDGDIEYARVHPVDDARVERILERQHLNLPVVDRLNAEYAEAILDIDYLLSLLPQLSSSEPSEVERLNQCIAELERRLKIPFGKLRCALCGGPHDFDTSVPSVIWNSVIRAKGLPDYLCTTCIVREFVREGQGFTATLWNEEFNGIPIEVIVSGRNAKDAAAIQEENNSLRNQISSSERRCGEAAYSCLRYAEMIESQNDTSGQTENWSDFYRGQAYAARQLADAFAATEAGAGERKFEAKLLGFADDELITLCEECLRETVRHDLVTYSSALPAASSVPVAEGEPQHCACEQGFPRECHVHVFCQGCSEVGGADRAVYHAPPVCAPRRIPDDHPNPHMRGREILPCPDGIEGCEVLHLGPPLTPSTATPSAAVEAAAGEIVGLERPDMDRVAEIIRRYFPPTEAVGPAEEAQRLKADIDAFWTALDRGWEIEPREYFEKEAPENGFESALAMAVHYMWKRDTRTATARADAIDEAVGWLRSVKSADCSLQGVTIEFIDRDDAIAALEALKQKGGDGGK